MINKLKIIDTVRMTLRDKDGNIKSDRIVNNGLLHRLLCMLGLRHNSISKYGMAQVAALILTDVGGTAYDFIGIGNGTTAANVK